MSLAAGELYKLVLYDALHHHGMSGLNSRCWRAMRRLALPLGWWRGRSCSWWVMGG